MSATRPRVRRLSALLATLAAMTGAAAAQASAAQAACVYSNAFDGTNFNYTRCELADLDQVRSADWANSTPGLPNSGNAYCVPTSALDLITYIAHHGFPALSPGAGDWGPELGFPPYPHYNTMTNAIKNMGGLMGTDPFSGTSTSGLMAGFKQWLPAATFSQSHVAAWGAGGAPVRLEDMAAYGVAGGIVQVIVGRYKWTDDKQGYVRDGGHALALASAKGTADGGLIGLRDPAVTSNPSDTPFDQSEFGTEQYKVTAETSTFYGKSRVMQRVHGLAANAFLDGYHVIWPIQAFTAEKQRVMWLHPLQVHAEVGPYEPLYATFTSADGNAITDLAVDPAWTIVPYVTAAADAVWGLDPLTGRSTRLASLPGVRRVVAGGRALYAVTDDAIVALDNDGTLHARAALTSPVADIAYHPAHDLVVAISAATDQIRTFDAGLAVRTTVTMPKRLCSAGMVSLAVDPNSGAIWVQCGGSPQVSRVLLSDRRSTVDTIMLDGAHSPSALSMTDGRNPARQRRWSARRLRQPRPPRLLTPGWHARRHLDRRPPHVRRRRRRPRSRHAQRRMNPTSGPRAQRAGPLDSQPPVKVSHPQLRRGAGGGLTGNPALSASHDPQAAGVASRRTRRRRHRCGLTRIDGGAGSRAAHASR